jgi:hypothetical protein
MDEGVGRGGKQQLIFLGDLNDQISLLEAKTRMLVERWDWKTLLEKDEVRRWSKRNHC